MFLFIKLVADVDYSFLDKQHFIYIIELFKKNLIGLQLSGLQIT